MFNSILLLKAQDKDFAYNILLELTSPSMYGRGYNNNGVNKAYRYIVEKLISVGVPESNITSQQLKYNVNMVKKTFLKINTAILKDGYDYIIYPGSNSIKGKFSTYLLTKDNYNASREFNFSNRIIIVDTSISRSKEFKDEIENIKEKNTFNAAAYVFFEDNISYKGLYSKFNSTVIETKVNFMDAKEVNINFKKKVKLIKTRNIIVNIPGASDSIIILCAHYDHLGTFGKAYFPGANDNAAAIAMLIDIARELQVSKPYYSVCLIFFTGEEVGLKGSTYFVLNPTISLKKVKCVLNLDVVGSGENGFTIVNGTEYEYIYKRLDTLAKINNIDISFTKRGVSYNSDHAPFYLRKIPSVFIYASGKTGPYHHPDDTPQNLSLAKYNEIVRLLLIFVSNKE